MVKNLFIAALMISNLALAGYAWLLSKQPGYCREDVQRIDSARLEDIAGLEKLFKSSVSKNQVYSTLKKKFKEDEWFDKLDESGIGVGRLFLVFDKENQLAEIKAHSFDGP